MHDEQQADGLREFHERIPDAYRARGWRVQLIAKSDGEAEGKIGPTLFTAILANRLMQNVPSVQRAICETREEAVDDAVRELIRLHPLS